MESLYTKENNITLLYTTNSSYYEELIEALDASFTKLLPQKDSQEWSDIIDKMKEAALVDFENKVKYNTDYLNQPCLITDFSYMQGNTDNPSILHGNIEEDVAEAMRRCLYYAKNGNNVDIYVKNGELFVSFYKRYDYQYVYHFVDKLSIIRDDSYDRFQDYRKQYKKRELLNIMMTDKDMFEKIKKNIFDSCAESAVNKCLNAAKEYIEFIQESEDYVKCKYTEEDWGKLETYVKHCLCGSFHCYLCTTGVWTNSTIKMDSIMLDNISQLKEFEDIFEKRMCDVVKSGNLREIKKHFEDMGYKATIYTHTPKYRMEEYIDITEPQEMNEFYKTLKTNYIYESNIFNDNFSVWGTKVYILTDFDAAVGDTDFTIFTNKAVPKAFLNKIDAQREMKMRIEKIPAGHEEVEEQKNTSEEYICTYSDEDGYFTGKRTIRLTEVTIS